LAERTAGGVAQRQALLPSVAFRQSSETL